MKKIFKGATIRFRRVKVVVHFWGIDKSKLDKFLYLLGNVSKFFQQVLNLAELFSCFFFFSFHAKTRTQQKYWQSKQAIKKFYIGQELNLKQNVYLLHYSRKEFFMSVIHQSSCSQQHYCHWGSVTHVEKKSLKLEWVLLCKTLYNNPLLRKVTFFATFIDISEYAILYLQPNLCGL